MTEATAEATEVQVKRFSHKPVKKAHPYSAASINLWEKNYGLKRRANISLERLGRTRNHPTLGIKYPTMNKANLAWFSHILAKLNFKLVYDRGSYLGNFLMVMPAGKLLNPAVVQYNQMKSNQNNARIMMREAEEEIAKIRAKTPDLNFAIMNLKDFDAIVKDACEFWPETITGAAGGGTVKCIGMDDYHVGPDEIVMVFKPVWFKNNGGGHVNGFSTPGILIIDTQTGMLKAGKNTFHPHTYGSSREHGGGTCMGDLILRDKTLMQNISDVHDWWVSTTDHVGDHMWAQGAATWWVGNHTKWFEAYPEAEYILAPNNRLGAKGKAEMHPLPTSLDEMRKLTMLPAPPANTYCYGWGLYPRGHQAIGRNITMTMPANTGGYFDGWNDDNTEQIRADQATVWTNDEGTEQYAYYCYTCYALRAEERVKREQAIALAAMEHVFAKVDGLAPRHLAEGWRKRDKRTWVDGRRCAYRGCTEMDGRPGFAIFKQTTYGQTTYGTYSEGFGGIYACPVHVPVGTGIDRFNLPKSGTKAQLAAAVATAEGDAEVTRPIVRIEPENPAAEATYLVDNTMWRPADPGHFCTFNNCQFGNPFATEPNEPHPAPAVWQNTGHYPGAVAHCEHHVTRVKHNGLNESTVEAQVRADNELQVLRQANPVTAEAPVALPFNQVKWVPTRHHGAWRCTFRDGCPETAVWDNTEEYGDARCALHLPLLIDGVAEETPAQVIVRIMQANVQAQ